MSGYVHDIATGFSNILIQIKASKVTKMWLQSLMFVPVLLMYVAGKNLDCEGCASLPLESWLLETRRMKVIVSFFNLRDAASSLWYLFTRRTKSDWIICRNNQSERSFLITPFYSVLTQQDNDVVEQQKCWGRGCHSVVQQLFFKYILTERTYSSAPLHFPHFLFLLTAYHIQSAQDRTGVKCTVYFTKFIHLCWTSSPLLHAASASLLGTNWGGRRIHTSSEQWWMCAWACVHQWPKLFLSTKCSQHWRWKFRST